MPNIPPKGPSKSTRQPRPHGMPAPGKPSKTSKTTAKPPAKLPVIGRAPKR